MWLVWPVALGRLAVVGRADQGAVAAPHRARYGRCRVRRADRKGFLALQLSGCGQFCPHVDERLGSPRRGVPMMETRFPAAACVIAVTMSGGALAAPRSCESLASLHLPDTTITVAAVVAAGAFTRRAPRRPLTPQRAALPARSRQPATRHPVRSVDARAVGTTSFSRLAKAALPARSTMAGIAAACAGGYAGGSTDTGHVGATPTSRQVTRRRSSTSAGAHITFRPCAPRRSSAPSTANA